MIRFMETVIRHGSDRIDLVEGSGLVETRTTIVNGGPPQVVARQPDVLTIEEVPGVALVAPLPDLRTDLRAGAIVLHRRQPAGLFDLVDGRASGAELEPPAEPTYPLTGRLEFASGRLNPRLFAVSAGDASRPRIEIYRSPLAVRGDGGGVLSLALRYQDATPASWAVVTARVALPVADPTHTADRSYRGQADRRGELRIALTGLPAPTRAMAEADALDRTVTLEVRADPSASDAEAADPDGFPAAEMRGPDSAAFAAQTAFIIRPGGLIRLTSQSADHLTIRPIP